MADRGDLTSFIDANGNQTTYTYDNSARMIGMTEGAGSSVQRSATVICDDNGNLLSETTGIATNNPHVATTSFAYDEVNRLTRVIEGYGTSLALTSTIVYDLSGNPLRYIDPLGRTLSMTYDSRDRVTRDDEAFGSSVQRSATMLYDTEGNLTSTTTGIASTNANPVTTSFATAKLSGSFSIIFFASDQEPRVQRVARRWSGWQTACKARLIAGA